tara:strand:- start:35 stop:871 length:837 start_codon:yes stop_codon:yes gene_type:complete
VKRELIWSRALETSRHAIACGAVIPLETYKYKPVKNIFDYELRFLKRPFLEKLIEYGPKINPFIPWDSRLEVESINNKYTIILNKYPVQLGHILLITNNWKPQNGWLSIDDFEAISLVDNDTTGLWFFNSSSEAGASQPHRHFQLLRRHTYESICPRYEWFCSLLNNREFFYSDIKESVSIKPRNNRLDSMAQDLFDSYKSMIIDMNLGDINNDDKPLKPYNMLITENWISLIVRSTDRSHGFSINGLGFAGYFLATKNSEVDMLTKFGPENILKHVI